MTGVIQMFTRRGACATASTAAARSKAGGSRTARGSAGVSAKAGRVDYSADVAGYAPTTKCRTTSSATRRCPASAGAALAPGATLRFVGRGERGDAARRARRHSGGRISTRFFRRHDGVVGRDVRRSSDRARSSQRAAYGLASVGPGVDQSAARSAVHAGVRRPHRAVRVLRLRVSTAAPSCGATTPATRRTARSRARRARGHARRDRRSSIGTANARRCATRSRAPVPASREQRRRHAAAPGAVAARVRHRRRPLRAQRQLRRRDRAARRGRVVRAQRAGAVGARGCSASSGRGIKEPTDPAVVQPEAVLPGQSRSRAGAARDVRGRASSSGLLNDRAEGRASPGSTTAIRNIISTRTISFNPFRRSTSISA